MAFIFVVFVSTASFADARRFRRGTISLAAFSLPEQGMEMAKGQSFAVRGIIRSLSPLTEVRAVVYNASGFTETTSIINVFDNPNEYIFSEKTNRLSSKLKFKHLSMGKKQFALYASTSEESDVLLYKADFSVSTWGVLNETLVHGIGLEAIYDLYGGSDAFLFRFKISSTGGAWINIDPQWKSQNLTTVRGVGRSSYLVNIHAEEAFTNAFQHIRSSYVYITYNNGASGVFCLSKLIGNCSSDGAYAPRFTNAQMSGISHHAFGTAIDLNTDLRCNQVRVRNGVEKSWSMIYNGISRLSYNGIATVNGVENVYCFTYNGNRPSSGYAPECIRNYLLHELAFAREGFAWGAYFTNKCDAMHFSLTEPNDYGVVYADDTVSVNDRQRIQMVYTYVEDLGGAHSVRESEGRLSE